MSLARTVTKLLAGMTRYRLAGLSPADRAALMRECERVAREIIVEDARQAAAPRSGVLADLKDGRGHQSARVMAIGMAIGEKPAEETGR